MRVFLTGGTGLLGSHIAHMLRGGGHEVVALHRRNAETWFLRDQGCLLLEGDIRDEADSLSKGMSGCTHVVHAAALVYTGGEWPNVRAVNVDGTRNVLSAAAIAGVRHAVHISSVAVYGAGEEAGDESTPITSNLPPGDLYARSKREAEEVARGIERTRGLSVTIVRPAAVYGERDRLLIPALETLLRLPIVPRLGPATNTLPVVYAGNVADAIDLVLRAARGGETFDIGLDYPLTQRELLDTLAAALGRSPRFLTLPGALATGAARLLFACGVTTSGAKQLSLRRIVRLALGENPYPSERIRSELGWDPPHHHSEALARAGRWLNEHR